MHNNRYAKFIFHVFSSILFFVILAADLTAQVRIINEGFPGKNTAELDDCLNDVLDQLKPDYIILFAGANDALNEEKFLPAEESGRHLEAMAHRIKQKGFHLILVTVHDPDLSRLMKRHKPEIYGETPPTIGRSREKLVTHYHRHLSTRTPCPACA